MKKVVFLLTMMGGMLTAHAADYPYLTFETADGTKTSVSTESLTISIAISLNSSRKALVPVRLSRIMLSLC